MKTEIKSILFGAVIAITMLLTSGCNTGMVSSRVTTETSTIAFDGTPKTITQENRVTLLRGTFLVNSEVDKARIQWGDVKVDIGGYSTVGDAASINAIGNAITSGILAYFTYGTAPAVKAAVAATLQSSATNTPPMTTPEPPPPPDHPGPQ